ncbi:dihydroxyacetone kinase subunit DhaL [Actinomyces wuliandei]|uniref:dihydroxyacetone kinase subunit DhaL n=1 Tax=Actinomyces wuliandei TaxID=2057743 RepID=UPI000FDBE7FB|nr:dihydroxyacetone kinase subunit DhaL [Actinomyces wuliandei]
MSGSALEIKDLEAWIRRAAELVSLNAEALTELDAAIGDADHGINVKRGLQSAVSVLESGDFSGVDALLKRVGMTLVSTVGGASGPLYGTFFMRMGSAQTGQRVLDTHSLADAVEAGIGGIVERGRATIGDKTMLDAWYPALAALRANPENLVTAASSAAQAAARGRDATEAMVARRGRASYLGERSVGYIDPGAASTTLILQALSEVIEGRERAEGLHVDAGTSSGNGRSGAKVGLVLVSHSWALAEAALDLVTQLVGPVEVPVEIAAGLPQGKLGNDTAAVAEAIEKAAGPEGDRDVLILTDLGSAVMSAETALELIPQHIAVRTRLSTAAFVEGLIAAYTAVGVGRGLKDVAAEAEAAVVTKTSRPGAVV